MVCTRASWLSREPMHTDLRGSCCWLLPSISLFGLLMAVVAESDCRTVVRVAGGWVRDKLLGIRDGGGDIDLVVDNMPAVAFADLLARHRPSETKGGKVIGSRPEQHKHVEVVALKLLDGAAAIELSSHHGRTPEEEARRRDFTINSLLYNINQAAVEDFTGMGVADLRAGLLRTPLPPGETLGQDPLRILRFAARFGFRVDAQLAAAMKDAALQKELGSTIGRQRIAAEVTKMLSGPRPHVTLMALCEDDLHRIVFAPSKGPEFWTDELTRLARLAVELVKTGGREAGPEPVVAGPLAFWLACLFLPLGFSPLCLKDRDRETHLPFTKWDMREHWMFPDQVATSICTLIVRAHDLEGLALELDSTGAIDKLRVARVLRELGPSWVHALQLARVLSTLRLHVGDGSGGGNTAGGGVDAPLVDAVVTARFGRLEEWITHQSGLLAGPHGPAVWAVAPLVSAKTLLAALRARTTTTGDMPQPTGKDVGRLVALALDWQLARHDSNNNNDADEGADGATTTSLSSNRERECVAWVVDQWLALAKITAP